MANKINPEEAERRRRVIYHALSGILSSSQVQQAQSLWDQEFADHAGFVVSTFAQQLCRRLNLQQQDGKNIIRHLHRSMFLKLEDLGAVPTAGPARATASAAAAPSAPTPPVDDGLSASQTVFNALLVALAEQHQNQRSESLGSLRLQLLETIEHLGLSPGDKQTLRNWWRSSTSMRSNGHPHNLDQRAMSEVIHAAYVWSCEEFGPAKADNIMAAAVRTASQISQAQVFNPLKFL